MSNSPVITITGNLADDPELRFTQSGKPVANFRVGVTEKYRTDSGEWKDRDTSWFSVQCWNDLAEHVAESLTRGSRVIVTGVMRQRSYETKEGEKRYIWEVHADEVGAGLRYATVKIHKATRGNAPEDPWADSRGNSGGSGGNGAGKRSGGDASGLTVFAGKSADTNGEPPF